MQNIIARNTVLGAIAAIFTLTTTSASAAIVTITYDGVVSSGFDQTGVFGPANTALDGDAFRVVYKFDTSQGVANLSPTYNTIYGGSAIGTTSPWLRTVATINGVSTNVNGGFYSEIVGSNIGNFSVQFASVVDSVQMTDINNITTVGQDQISTIAYGYPGNLPATIDQPFYVNTTGDLVSGNLSIFDYVSDANGNYISARFANADLATTSITETIDGGVPEPATWVVLMLGFGAAGAVLRRRGQGPMSTRHG